MLRFEYSRGVRFFDTAATYGTEEAFKKWFAAMPEARRQIFLATKDGVARPGDMIKRIDLRLERWGPTTSTCFTFMLCQEKRSTTG